MCQVLDRTLNPRSLWITPGWWCRTAKVLTELIDPHWVCQSCDSEDRTIFYPEEFTGLSQVEQSMTAAGCYLLCVSESGMGWGLGQGDS